MGNVFDKYYLDDECRCVYCKLDGRTDIRIWSNLTLDHVVPLPKDHPDRHSEFNLAVACHGCNGLKATFDPSGQMKAAASREERNRLIEIATGEINRRQSLRYDWFRRHGGIPPMSDVATP